jgi:hypothetical protein
MNTQFAKLAERIVAVPSMFQLAPRQDADQPAGIFGFSNLCASVELLPRVF